MVIMLFVTTAAAKPTATKDLEHGLYRRGVRADGQLSALLRRNEPNHLKLSSAMRHLGTTSSSLLEESDESDDAQGGEEAEGEALEGGVSEEQFNEEQDQVELQQNEGESMASSSDEALLDSANDGNASQVPEDDKICFNKAAVDDCMGSEAVNEHCKWHATSGAN